MYGLPEAQWLSWQRKRKRTLIGFVLVGTLMGIDCSVITSTLLLYLRDTLQTTNPEMWFGVITSCLFVSSTISGAICGRWLDNTRNVRFYVKLTLTAQSVGFLIYSLPYHPAILLVARLICGIGDPFTNVVSGEVFRIYNEKQRTRAMLLLASIYSFGFIIGPGLNFLFQRVDFHVGPIPVNNLNFIGIFQAGLLFVVMGITHFLVHNCSKEFDLKEYIALHGDNDVKSETEDNEQVKESNGSLRDNGGSDKICGKKVMSYHNEICDDIFVEVSTPSMEVEKVTKNENDSSYHVTKDESTNNEDDLSTHKHMSEDISGSTIESIPKSENDSSCHVKNDDSPMKEENSPEFKDLVEATYSSNKITEVDSACTGEKPTNGSPSSAKGPKNEIVPLKIVLRSLISEPNTFLVFLSTFAFVYTIMVASIMMPIVVEDKLRWGLNTFNVLYTSFGVADFFFICLMTKVCKTARAIYYASLISIVSQVFTCALLICIKMLPRSYNRDMVLVVAFFISIMIGWLFDDVLVRVILANFVPSQIQSFSEALRSGVCRLSMIIASLTVAISFWSWVHWWSAVIAILNIILFVVFVIRASHFIKPRELTLQVKNGTAARIDNLTTVNTIDDLTVNKNTDMKT